MDPARFPAAANSWPRGWLGFGLLAFLVAALSVFDMYLPRPYDGVVLQSDSPGRLAVLQVVPGSGADEAGIIPGDQIVGIARSALRDSRDAAVILNRHEVGEVVPYLVRRGTDTLHEVEVELGTRRIGGTAYLYACLLGFSFFFIGLFVLLNQPSLGPSRIFFLLCSLFLLVLICGMRPASYSWVDLFVLTTGTAALLFLPATFLHFFMIFPHPVWDGEGAPARPLERRSTRRVTLAILYLIPIAVFAAEVFSSSGERLARLGSSPPANWWVLAVFILLGLVALASNARRLRPSNQRKGAALVFFGALFGLLPFVLLAVAVPSVFHKEQFIFYGVIPLILVPLTFAYSIVRFQLMDIRVILKKSLLYTVMTAVVTLLYGVAIASFNAIFRGTEMEKAAWFPVLFALTIVLLFEPLRRRLQVPIDQFFFAERSRLQTTMVEMGRAFAEQLDPGAVVRNLVQRLPQLLDLRFAALYLARNSRLERVAGPQELPSSLPLIPILYDSMKRQSALTRLDDLGSLRVSVQDVDQLVTSLEACGVEVIGDLASSRRSIGLVLLSGKKRSMPFDPEELRLLRGLFHQAAMALETSLLLEERAKRAELEGEMKIAAAIQSSLLPSCVEIGLEWEVAAVCRPAREVSGDFFAELPGPRPGSRAVVYGDVSGKSVSGALMMMAAKEALHSIAGIHSEPVELFSYANERLYELGKRSFVALGYFASTQDGSGLQYVVAGQPQPLKLTAEGGVVELPLPEHRLPLGAMNNGQRHSALSTEVRSGEVVFAYSDGVLEAQSPEGEFFGADRLTAVIRAAPRDPVRIIQEVLSAIDQFRQGTEAYDDVTLLAISRRQEVAG